MTVFAKINIDVYMSAGSENSYVKSVVGITLGLVTAVVLVAVAIVVIAINIARRKRPKKGNSLYTTVLNVTYAEYG